MSLGAMLECFFGGVCYAHLLSFLWWCLLRSPFKLSLVVFAMLIF
jgi:hypothetical protein